MPTRSCRYREELIEFRNGFAMVKAVGDHSEGQGLNLHNGLFTSLPICHDPGQVGHLGDPATIIFTLDLDFHRVVLLTQDSPTPNPQARWSSRCRTEDTDQLAAYATDLMTELGGQPH